MDIQGNAGMLSFAMVPEIHLAPDSNILIKRKEKNMEQITNITNEIQTEKPTILYEAQSMREESVKHFRMSDGSFMAAMYPTPVHFKSEAIGSEETKWEEIDNTLVETEKGYRAKASPQNIVLPKDLSQGNGVQINDEQYPLSWKYDLAPMVQPGDSDSDSDPLPVGEKRIALTNPETKQLSGDERYTALQKLSGEAVYKGIKDQVDLEYIVMPTGLKENIVLHSPLAENEYTITYHTGTLTAKQQDEKTLLLLDEDGETIYEITTPYMTDANGEISEGISLTLLDAKDGFAKAKISASREWLDEPDRTYPVRLDPVTRSKLQSANIQYAYTDSANPGVNHHNFDLMPVGRYSSSCIYTSYLKFTGMPSLPPASAITEASLGLVIPDYILNGNQMGYYLSVQNNIVVKKINSAWDPNTINWSNSQQLQVSPVVSAYCKTDAINKLYTWDITKMVSEWYQLSNVNNNNGLQLSSVETSQDKYVRFVSPMIGSQYANMYPQVYVTYRTQIGLEDYWTAHEQHLGRSGIPL